MDSSLYVRRAGVAHLKAAAPLASVPADRIYPPQRPAVPVWPFVGWGVPASTPFGATCLDGSVVVFAVHAYAETSGEGDDTVGGEEAACAIAAAVVASLNGQALPLDAPYSATAHYDWTGTLVFQDGTDPNAFHAVVNMRATVSS